MINKMLFVITLWSILLLAALCYIRWDGFRTQKQMELSITTSQEELVAQYKDIKIQRLESDNQRLMTQCQIGESLFDLLTSENQDSSVKPACNMIPLLPANFDF